MRDQVAQLIKPEKVVEHFWAYFFVALGWMCGGIIGGATGIGAVMIAMPILTVALAPGDAILVSSLISAVACLHLTWAYRRFAVWKDVWPLLVGMLPGEFVGVMILKIAPVPVLELMICTMLACFLLMQSSPRLAKFSLSSSLPVGIGSGTVCGFVHSSVTMSGAPLGIYVLLRHWDPDRARGNMSVFYMGAALSAVVMQGASGMFTPPMFRLALAGLGGCVLGQTLGVYLGKRIGGKTFRHILLCFLAVAAIVLFVRAVS